MKSLVIDVRGNPGGLLVSAVEVADRFVDRGVIVSTRGRSAQEDFTYSAHEQGKWQMPLVVIIDQDSASAAEIFAGAIRDHHRGTIVGVRSFGKGSVQGIFPLDESNAGVRLTTAKFYSPNGRPYSRVGVEPDIRRCVLAAPADRRQAPGGRRRHADRRAASRPRTHADAASPAYALRRGFNSRIRSAATSPPWMQSGNAHAVIGVAGQSEMGQRRRAGLDPRDQLLVADVILRHRAGPMGNVAVAGLAANPQQPRQLAEHQRLSTDRRPFRPVPAGAPRPRTPATIPFPPVPDADTSGC